MHKKWVSETSFSNLIQPKEKINTIVYTEVEILTKKSKKNCESSLDLYGNGRLLVGYCLGEPSKTQCDEGKTVVT